MERISRRRLALPALLLGSFMGVLDPFVVTVALPTIGSDLAATAAQTQWMVAGYGATYGVGLVVGGRIGDRYGRRRLFLAGMSAYVAASLAAGLAPATGALVAARLAQGLAAAAMLPQVLSIIRTGFAQPVRDRAVGWYGASIGSGVVCGPVLGGLLVAADIAGAGWRSVFLVNLPLGALVIIAAAMAVPESRAAGRRLDLLGAAIGAAAVLAFLVPVSQGPEAGWPWWTITLLASAPVLVAGFLHHERRLERLGRDPIVPLRLFSRRGFTGGIVAILLLYAAGAGAPLAFVLTYYLQDGIGAPPVWTGLVLAPLGLGFAVASAVAPRWYRRYGPAVAAVGSGVVVVALVGLAAVAVAVPVVAQPGLVTALMLVAGLGQGLAANPVIALVMAAAPDEAAGAASGLLLTTTQVGNIVGLTGIGAVYFALLRPDAPAGAAHALAWSVSVLAGGAAVASVVTAALHRTQRYLPNSCTQ